MIRPIVPAVAPSSACVLVVDDDIENRYLTAQQLRTNGFMVHEACSAAEALRLLTTSIRFDAIVTDYQMPGDMNGIELADAIRARSPSMPIVIVSGADISSVVAGKGMEFFSKPFSIATLVHALRKSIPGL